MQVGWAERGGAVVLVVRGLPAGSRPRVLPAELLDAGRTPAARPGMAGRWQTADGEVVFEPRFPLVPDTGYAVVADDDVVVLRTPPVPGRRRTRVVAVEPALDVVPRNLLRFQVQFSAPMAGGWAGRCVRLERADTGDVLTGALLSLDPELWDARHRRLTVLLDPARIKRGLLPHAEAGYPLTEGEEVRLVVDAGFPDAEGRGLVAAASASFRVGADLRGRVRPDDWTIATPPAATRQPLRIAFDRPLDRRLVQRCVRVLDVRSAATAAPDGRGLAFLPDAPWPPGPVRIAVDPALEDVAGNSVARVFDRDLRDPADDPLEVPGVVVLTVQVTAPPDRRLSS